jgi:hypothetical protein
LDQFWAGHQDGPPVDDDALVVHVVLDAHRAGDVEAGTHQLLEVALRLELAQHDADVDAGLLAPHHRGDEAREGR